MILKRLFKLKWQIVRLLVFFDQYKLILIRHLMLNCTCNTCIWQPVRNGVCPNMIGLHLVMELVHENVGLSQGQVGLGGRLAVRKRISVGDDKRGGSDHLLRLSISSFG